MTTRTDTIISTDSIIGEYRVQLKGIPLEQAIDNGFAHWRKAGHDRTAKGYQRRNMLASLGLPLPTRKTGGIAPLEMMPMSLQHRMAVNHLRHHCLLLGTEQHSCRHYDKAIKKFGKRDAETYEAVKSAAHQAISELYPELAVECDRQTANSSEDYAGYGQRRADRARRDRRRWDEQHDADCTGGYDCFC